jgi:hypothetical protein
MRHLGSLLAGILIAPAAWVLIALGQQKSLATLASWQQSGGFNTADLLLPAAYLLAAGILIGLIATLRISPLGALIAGLFYAGTYVALFFNPVRVRNAVPESLRLLGRTVAPRAPLDNGTLLLIGAALLVAVFSFGRWRRWPAAAPAAAPAEEAGEPGDAPGSTTDLAPGPADEERTVAVWPPSGTNPWTPTARPTADSVDTTASYSAAVPNSQFGPAPTPQFNAPPPGSPTTFPPPSASTFPPSAEPPRVEPPRTQPPPVAPPPSTEDSSAEPESPPPTSPWSAPPPRSGQG